MYKCIASRGEAKLFSTLDASSRYWKIDIDKKEVDKTASLTHIEMYKCTGILLGSKNAPATFQRAMDVRLVL